MKKIKITVSTAALSLAAFALVAASPAHAEIDAATADQVVTSALENLGVAELSPELAQDLSQSLVEAEEAGLVSQEIIDAVSGQLADTPPSPTTDAEPEAAVDPVENLLDDQLDSHQQDWDNVSVLWQEAFQTVRADFEACREAGSSTSECARTFAFTLQINHAELTLADIDAKIADVPNLPEEEQAAALAELEAERAAVEAHLVRAQTKLATVATGTPSDASKVSRMLDKVREKGNSLAALGASVGVNRPENQSGGAEGNLPAQSGQPAQSGRKAAESVTPGQTPSAKPSTAGSNSGGNVPANPGKSGEKGNSNAERGKANAN